MMVIISNVKSFEQELLAALTQFAPDLDVCLPDDPAAVQAEVAACWFPQAGQLARLPHLKLVHSVAAGIDHLNTSLLATDVAICRVVDEHHQRGMLEYIQWGVLYFQRHFDQALHNQRNRHWQRYPQLSAGQLRLGFLGLGAMGAYIAAHFAQQGYNVSGWARSKKCIPGVTAYSGDNQLNTFLGDVDLLINLLPLTPQTENILSQPLFARLPQGAALINCGRGKHLNGDDLLAGIGSHHLRGAILDVFPQEPLPPNHPLWNTPGVVITPHMASAAPIQAIATQIADNARRLHEGRELLNKVNREMGY